LVVGDNLVVDVNNNAEKNKMVTSIDELTVVVHIENVMVDN
jgi:hypothetical protein